MTMSCFTHFIGASTPCKFCVDSEFNDLKYKSSWSVCVEHVLKNGTSVQSIFTILKVWVG